MKKRGIVKKILLGILLILFVFLLGLFVFHYCKKAADRKFLEEKGYLHLVQTGDHALNVVRFGKENAARRIVVLSGMGGGFQVEMRKMTAELEQKYELIYAARAGWDGSDDVKTERTVESIVEDYRDALRSAGVPAPYTLMAHSMGGAYASYWVSKYPDEIEAFADIDGTYVEPTGTTEAPAAKRFFPIQAVVRLGIGDLLLAFTQKDPFYTAEEQRAANAMMLQSFSAAAVHNEGEFVDRNLNTIWNALVQTDVPKLYISARDGYTTEEEIENGPGLNAYQMEYYTKDYTGDEAGRTAAAYANFLAECEENRTEKLIPYLEKMGKCRIEYLPGDHFIHKTEPEKCGKIIQAFLEEQEENDERTE